MTISYRLFDFHKDNLNDLFDLYKATYGDDKSYRDRWEWEYGENPGKKDIKIIIAESEGKIVGATTRLPFRIKYRGKIVDTAFSVNSMVHPDFRRKGIMDKLYHKGAELFEVLFSKGTMPGMYKLLMRMGYKKVYPDTYMTALLSPVCWVMWKLKIYTPEFNLKKKIISGFKEFQLIDNFEKSFDDFYSGENVGDYDFKVLKNSGYMNWRYINNPLKSYRCFYRKINNKIVSVVVLSNNGGAGKIVDIIWDSNKKDEPGQTIRFAKSYLKKNGMLKVSCWSLVKSVRAELKRNGFIERPESMNLSIYSSDSKHDLMQPGNTYTFVEGDGDVEYLS